MAAAMMSCRVLGGSATHRECSPSALLPPHIRGVRTSRPVSSCSGRIVGATFGGCLRIARGRSESMAVSEV